MICIPIRDLKDTSDISQMCHAANEPIIITGNGYEDMVIMSAIRRTRNECQTDQNE